jgi:23S rRNA pseudouridine1911/1915/1917 synthase
LDGTALTYVVDLLDHNLFLRDILSAKFQLSHSLIVRLKQHQKIKVNGNTKRTNYQVQAGDQITIDLDFIEKNEIIPEAFPLDIIYEDVDFLVINKAAGMPIHPSKRKGRGTLANAVTYYWQRSGRHIRFRPINRLDKDTSGLVLIGNSQFAHQSMFQQFNQHRAERYYLAITEGVLEQDNGRIDHPIARLDDNSRKRIVDPDGQTAITNYQVLERYSDHTLVLLRLETGRTHQIRVHLSYLGHPIAGDELYGNESSLLNRQALHAGVLRFFHPRMEKELTFSAPLPEDIQSAIIQLRK